MVSEVRPGALVRCGEIGPVRSLAWIEQHRDQYSTPMTCELLSVSRRRQTLVGSRGVRSRRTGSTPCQRLAVLTMHCRAPRRAGLLAHWKRPRRTARGVVYEVDTSTTHLKVLSRK